MPATTRYGFPYPGTGQSPRVRQDLTNLATAVDTSLFNVRTELASSIQGALAQALAGIEDARGLQSSGAVATGNVTVTTAQQGVPGGATSLPANIGALVLTTFDVTCDVWNSVSAFEGRLGFIRLSDGADMGNASGSAIYVSGVVNGRVTVTTAYLLGPVNYGRNLQLRVTKSTTGAGYVVSQSTTKLNVVRLRTGAA